MRFSTVAGTGSHNVDKRSFHAGLQVEGAFGTAAAAERDGTPMSPARAEGGQTPAGNSRAAVCRPV